jgi:hypothetical protein
MRLNALPLIALVAAAVAGVASAAPSKAPPKPVDWIDISIDHVTTPDPAPGDCVVSGWVVTVRDGAKYKPGSAISLSVPCVAAGASAGGEVSGFDLAAVGASKNASVKIDGSGRVVAYTPKDTATDPTK